MPLSFGTRRLSSHLLVAVVLVGCSDSGPESKPVTLIAVSGNAQSVTNAPAAELESLVVKVLGARDRGVSRVDVTWTTSEPDASVRPATVETNRLGEAKVLWSLGAKAGLQTATATTSAVPGASAVFTGTNNVVAISGAVSVASSEPRIFTATSAIRGAVAALVVPTASRRAATSEALRTTGAPNRRLLMRFRGPAMGIAGRAAITRLDLDRSSQFMRDAIAGVAARGVIAKLEPSPAIMTTRITVPAGVAMDSAIATLRGIAGVQSVVAEQRRMMLDDDHALAIPARARSMASQGGMTAATGALPSEQYLFYQYWHYNMVEAPRAWSTQTGSANVIVAVVDNGIRFDHPTMATCSDYKTCTAGNLTTDGYNFVSGGNRLDTLEAACEGGQTLLPEAGPSDDPTQPDDRFFTGTCWQRDNLGDHGLHVAGTIGARGNDGVGVTGLNWVVKIRPIRVLDITGSGSDFDVAQGILYAAGLPASGAGGATVTAPSRAPIINMSLGGSFASATMASAVAAATAAGSLIIAAAGNALSYDNRFIPASYPEVLAVSALGPDMQLASYTNISSNVSLSAPGGDFRLFDGTGGVLSSVWDFVNGVPDYAFYEGTSMATPHVSGVAALVLAANPGLTNSQLRARLQNTAVHLGAPGRDDRYGYGAVSAYRAVNNIINPVTSTRVEIVNATSGAVVRKISTAADGSFSAQRLPVGSYWVVAGQDESGDGKVGVPGRRYGWFGARSAPTDVSVSATQSATVAILAGTPVESKPNGTVASANRLVLNGYVMGQINSGATDAYFTFTIPSSSQYVIETNGVMGTCGAAMEVDTYIELLAATGSNVLASNDDASFFGSALCSRITRTLGPGKYYVHVRASDLPGFVRHGQYTLQVRDAP